MKRDVLLDVEDMIQSIHTDLKKAQLVQWDLTHEFLGQTDEQAKRLTLALHYDKAHYQGLIIQDNLHAIEEKLAKIQQLIEASDDSNKATTHEKEFQSV